MNRYPHFFEATFLEEGYFQNDPHDKGNYHDDKLYGTICGITARDHFKEYQTAKQLYDMRKMGLLKDYCMRFYEKKGYWKEGFNEIADSSLAYKLFDLGVNMGQETPIKILQKSLKKYYEFDIEPTGQLDTKTIELANTAFFMSYKGKHDIEPVIGESILYAVFINEAKKHYKSLKGFNRYGRTWLRRLANIFNNTPDKIALSLEAKPTEKIKNIV